VYLDADVLRAARVMAARTGRRDSEIVEEALRRYLGISILEQVWARSPRDLTGDQALELANRELHEMRAGR
jgi:Arc/MetJ family transcription regulator